MPRLRPRANMKCRLKQVTKVTSAQLCGWGYWYRHSFSIDILQFVYKVSPLLVIGVNNGQVICIRLQKEKNMNKQLQFIGIAILTILSLVYLTACGGKDGG